MSTKTIIRLGGGGSGGGVVPPPATPLAPNIKSASARVSYAPYLNAQDTVLDGYITLPTTDPLYKYLTRIEVYAVDSDGNQTFVSAFDSSDWLAATSLYYRGDVGLQPDSGTVTYSEQFVCYNADGVPTPNPYTLTGIVASTTPAPITFSVAEIADSQWDDLGGGLHMVVGITFLPAQWPQNYTFWLDFADGAGWRNMGAYDIKPQVIPPSHSSPGHTLPVLIRIGDPSSTLSPPPARQPSPTITRTSTGDVEGPYGVVWVPTDPTLINWKCAAAPGVITGNTPPDGFLEQDFTVTAALPTLPSDIWDAQFLYDPANPNSQVTYTLQEPGLWTWHFYCLQYTQPTLSQDSNYWFSFPTVQKGYQDSGGVWHPAPDREGVDEAPEMYMGRKFTDSGAVTGTNGPTGTVVRIPGTSWPDWTYPPLYNLDGSVNPYRTFRFWIWSVSRLGTNASGGDGTITLDNAFQNVNHYDLTPLAPTNATLNLGASNPNSVGNGLMVKVDPVTNLNQVLVNAGSEFHFVTVNGVPQLQMAGVDFSKGFNGFSINGNTVPMITIYSNGQYLGWIGQDVPPPVGSGYAGAWFKRCYIGGTSPANAPIAADANGNVVINGSIIVGTVASASVASTAGYASSAGTVAVFNGTVQAVRIIGWDAQPLLIGGGVVFQSSGWTVLINDARIRGTELAISSLGPVCFGSYYTWAGGPGAVPGLVGSLTVSGTWVPTSGPTQSGLLKITFSGGLPTKVQTVG